MPGDQHWSLKDRLTSHQSGPGVGRSIKFSLPEKIADKRYKIREHFKVTQKIVEGSASKLALVQDTNYMVWKKYHISPYLGAFGAYLMTQGPI